ncbi:MAG: hypothetical protein N3B21_16315 [Clostridia bacterium]|nr:hypothetical protein [Clostridia bacterium]
MPYIERPRFSCALGGALSTLNSLPGVVPVIHASAGCGGNVFASQQAGSAYYGAGYCGGLAVPSSNVSENEIVFGGEDRLREQIANTLDVVEGQLYVVITGCMTEIIGDDTTGIARGFRNQGKPVLAVDTGGFKGNSYRGYDLVLERLFSEQVQKANEKAPDVINLWGAVPGQDPFFRGDLAELKRLLGLLGMKANTFFSYDETLENLNQAGSSVGNIVISRTYGVEAARTFEQVHQTPFIAVDIPIGPAATAEFLRKAADFAGINASVVEKIIADEQRDYYRYIERIADVYADLDLQHYGVVVGNASYSYSITRFLAEDLGWLPELVVITDCLGETHKEELKVHFGEIKYIKTPKVVFETDSSEIQKHLAEHWPLFSEKRYFHSFSPAFVFGSALERDLAAAIGAKHLTVSFPASNRAVLNRGYAGFKGGLHLIEDILDVLVAGR